MDGTSLLDINSKEEIITFDKILSISYEQLVINQLHIYFYEETNNEFVLYFLFKILANNDITVVFMFFL